MKGKMAEKHHETMEKKEEHERHREKRADLDGSSGQGCGGEAQKSK